VDVIRQTRPVAFYKQESREAQSKALRCEEEKTRMQAEQGGPGGLRGLLAAGLLTTNLGVVVKRITTDLKPRPLNALGLLWAFTYRAGGSKTGRVAAEVALTNPGMKPWTPAGAMLRGVKGEELTPLPEATPVSILPGEEGGRIMVEFEAATNQARGAYTLTLWDADGRSVILDNVTFP
jgi:uncharacterized protein (TIGR02268 family)